MRQNDNKEEQQYRWSDDGVDDAVDETNEKTWRDSRKGRTAKKAGTGMEGCGQADEVGKDWISRGGVAGCGHRPVTVGWIAGGGQGGRVWAADEAVCPQ